MDQNQDNKISQDTLQKNLEDIFIVDREKYNKIISDISVKMKKIFDIPEIMTTIYTERQNAVEYYHYLISVLIKINKKYRTSYTEKYEKYTFNTSFRYPSETAKNNKIYSDLSELLERREILENHSKFINNTIQTLDNLIYALPKRIEIENIARGK